jgi:hypothetical protein
MKKDVEQICEKVRRILFAPNSRTAGNDSNATSTPFRPEIEKLILALKNNQLTKIEARCKIFGLEHALLTTLLAPQESVDAATSSSQKILVHVVWFQISQNDTLSKAQCTEMLENKIDDDDVVEIVDVLEHFRKKLDKDGFFPPDFEACQTFNILESKTHHHSYSVKQIIHRLIETQYCDVRLALIKEGITCFTSDRFFGFDRDETFVLKKAEKFSNKGKMAQNAAKRFYEIAKEVHTGMSCGMPGEIAPASLRDFVQFLLFLCEFFDVVPPKSALDVGSQQGALLYGLLCTGESFFDCSIFPCWLAFPFIDLFLFDKKTFSNNYYCLFLPHV